MTLAQMQAKYNGIQTLDEISTLQQNMTNSKGEPDREPVPKKGPGRHSTKGSIWEQFINMNRVKGPVITPLKSSWNTARRSWMPNAICGCPQAGHVQESRRSQPLLDADRDLRGEQHNQHNPVAGTAGEQDPSPTT